MQDVSKILKKKNYGHRSVKKNARVKESLSRGQAPSFAYPRWMAVLFVLIITVACLGEDKALNVRFGGLPKAITMLVLVMAFFVLILRGNLGRFRTIGPVSVMYLLYWGVLCLWSAVLWVINFSDNSAITRGVEKMLFQTIAVLVAIAAVYLFGHRTVDFFAIGIYLANGAIALMEMPHYGSPFACAESLIHLVTSFGNGEGYALALEIHEVTFLYGMFLVYYLVFAPRETAAQKRMNRLQIICSVILLLTGFKRLLIPCIPLAALLAWFVRRRKNPMRHVLGIGIFWTVFYVVFLCFVYNRGLQYAARMLGINMMGRDYIWELAKRYYTFSPLYMGSGFGTVDAVIVAQLYEAKLIDQAYPLHNDVLKVFIEFGAPGLLIWSGAQYIAFPLLIKKFFDADTAVLYISVLTLMSTTYLTDNTAFYFWCMMALRMIPLAYGIYRKSKFSEIKEEKAKWSPPSRSDFSQLVNERLARDGGKK